MVAMAQADASPLTRLHSRRYREGAWEEIEDLAAIERPLFLRAGGGREARLWSAPLELERLAVGHALLTWCGPDEAARIKARDGENIEVEIHPHAMPVRKLASPGRLGPAEIIAGMRLFIGDEGLWDGTGCFHRAAAFDAASGTFLARAEDIGRHNCLDRLAAWALEDGVNLGDTVLFISARITGSLYRKAYKAGFRFMISRSAVTSASRDMAREAGVTLVGFAREREGRFTVLADEAQLVAEQG